MSQEEQHKFIKEYRQCYGCLEQVHRRKYCKQCETCEKCGKRHRTVMCGNFQLNSGLNANAKPFVPAQVFMGKVSRSFLTKSSMIVPVWMSHDSKPGETLVYAMLDTQSDTTFLLKKIADDLNLPSTETTLELSTMASENELIDSTKIDGLHVRAFQGNKRVELPTVFTGDIMPTNRSHIPTKDMAKKWPHLEVLVNELPPVQYHNLAQVVAHLPTLQDVATF